MTLDELEEAMAGRENEHFCDPCAQPPPPGRAHGHHVYNRSEEFDALPRPLGEGLGDGSFVWLNESGELEYRRRNSDGTTTVVR